MAKKQTGSDFFASPQGAAVFKHALLRAYVPAFVNMLGSTAKGRRVAYLDGFAGCGMYDDESPGSPILAAETASFFEEKGLSNLECHYVERKPAYFTRLERALAGVEHSATLHSGTLDQHLDEILRRIDRAPLFAFLDPFGLFGVTFDDLTGKILSRDVRRAGVKGGATEVLLNFSLSGLRRTAGHLESTSRDARYLRSRGTILAQVDATLGGDWWRDIWTSGDPRREELIFAEYLKRVTREKTSGRGYFMTPVRDSVSGPPAYFLALFTHYPERAFWVFHEAISTAKQRFFEYSAQDQPGLFGEFPDDELVDSIYENLRERLGKRETVRVGRDNLKQVFGGGFGFAREKHLRKAVKKLHREGLTSHDGKGKLAQAVLKPVKP